MEGGEEAAPTLRTGMEANNVIVGEVRNELGHAAQATVGPNTAPGPTHLYPTTSLESRMAKVKLDEKGRVSIPAEIRREIGLGEGEEVVIDRVGSTLVLRKVAPQIPTVNSRGG